MKTREQKYASRVYDIILKKTSLNTQAEKNKYGSIAHKLPILIRRAGLAQALEFVNTRKDAQQEILGDLASVIDCPELLDRSREAEIEEYMFLTEQCLAALLWFKRAVQSIWDITADVNPEGEPTK